MKDRRKFIKTVAAGTGGLVLTGNAAAQMMGPQTNHIPAVVSLLLDEPQVVTSGAASSSSLITTANVIAAASSSETVSIGIPPVTMPA